MRPLPPITSRANAKVKALRAGFAGRASAPGELIALEGEHLLQEAAGAGVKFETMYVREGAEVGPGLAAVRFAERVVLSREVFDWAMDTATPQGVAATLAIPESRVPNPGEPGVVLILEHVQDPGNVGTLIRSAAAFGALQVWLVGECANPWSPKVMRASSGAVFHVPVGRVSLEEAVAGARPRRRVFAAVTSRPGAVEAMAANLVGAALLIGSEGRGLSQEAIALADALVTIPCRMESFNAAVAGSLLLYEAFRQGASVGVSEREAVGAV